MFGDRIPGFTILSPREYYFFLEDLSAAGGVAEVISDSATLSSDSWE